MKNFGLEGAQKLNPSHSSNRRFISNDDWRFISNDDDVILETMVHLCWLLSPYSNLQDVRVIWNLEHNLTWVLIVLGCHTNLVPLTIRDTGLASICACLTRCTEQNSEHRICGIPIVRTIKITVLFRNASIIDRQYNRTMQIKRQCNLFNKFACLAYSLKTLKNNFLEPRNHEIMQFRRSEYRWADLVVRVYNNLVFQSIFCTLVKLWWVATKCVVNWGGQAFYCLVQPVVRLS